MKKLILISFFFSFFSLPIFAQLDTYDLVSVDESFILLTNDSLLFEKDYTVEEKRFSAKYYDLSGNEIKAIDLKFMGLNSEMYGFYHYKGYGETTTPLLAIRKIIGKVDLYQQNKTYSNDSKGIFYSKGFEGLKPLKYNFLKEDLMTHTGSDFEQRNAVVMEYLEKGKKKKNTAYALLGTGFAVFMVGAAISDKNERSIAGLSLSIGGLATMVVSLGKFSKDKEHYLEAVRAYNRF